MHRLQIVLLALCTLLASVSTAQEPARLALLIGNQEYTGEIQALMNPRNDIKALESDGFRAALLPDAGREVSAREH